MVGGATLVSRVQSSECDWVLIIPDYSQESPGDHPQCHSLQAASHCEEARPGQAGDKPGSRVAIGGPTLTTASKPEIICENYFGVGE